MRGDVRIDVSVCTVHALPVTVETPLWLSVGADPPDRLTVVRTVGGLLDLLDLVLDMLGHVARKRLRSAATEARNTLLGLPGPHGLHAVGSLLGLLAVHGRADADLELSHPPVGRGHCPVVITACLLERIDERSPSRAAATRQLFGLVGDDAVDLATADEVEQLAELGPVAPAIAVPRRRRCLDQLGEDLEFQPSGGLPARLDLHLKRSGAFPRDRLLGVERGATRGATAEDRRSERARLEAAMINEVRDVVGDERAVRATKALSERSFITRQATVRTSPTQIKLTPSWRLACRASPEFTRT